MTINSVTVVNGSAGNIGPPGPEGSSYDGTSVTPFIISVGEKTFICDQLDLAYHPGSRVRFSSAALPIDDWMEGIVTSFGAGIMFVDIDLISPTRDAYTHDDWNLSVAGNPGVQGNAGAQGVAGRAGNVIWQGTTAPTGSNPASPVNGDWYLQSTPATPGSPAYLFGPYVSGGAGSGWGTGLLLAVGPTGPQGATGATGATGPAGPQGTQGDPGPQGVTGAIGNTGPQGVPGASYGGTSLTALTIGAGSTTVITQAGLAYTVGTRVKLAAFSSPTSWMEGAVTAYSGTSLTFTADLVNGTGSFSNWTLSLAGERGPQGPAGPAGSGSGDMLRANNLSDLTNISTARNNLGLAAVAASGNYSDLSGQAKPRAQRLVTASPIVIASTDEVINCDISTGTPSCNLPASAGRSGRLLTLKDVGGHFGANILTVVPNGAEKIDGLSALTLNTNRQVIHLMPLNDGTNSGWAIV